MDVARTLTFDTDDSEAEKWDASSSPPTSPELESLVRFTTSRPTTPRAGLPQIEDFNFAGIESPTPASYWVKPTLADFVYQGTNFPAEPPLVTSCSSSLDRTVELISTLLHSTTNDLALSFLMDHKEILRLFEPASGFDFVNGQRLPRSYEIRGEDSGSAMAWYLLDRRVEPEAGAGHGHCYSCGDIDGLGPFRECFVPQATEAMGACTNCVFVGQGDQCSMRLRPFQGFTEDMLEEATREELQHWRERILTEMANRVLDAEMASRVCTGTGHNA